MTREARNVAILKQAYLLWNRNKEQAFDHWLALMDANIDWRSIANGAQGVEFTVSRSSKDGVLQYFQALAKEWEMLSYDANEFIAQGDRVVMVGRCEWRNRRTLKEIKTPKVDIFRMKDGRIVEFFELYDTAMVLAAAS